MGRIGLPFANDSWPRFRHPVTKARHKHADPARSVAPQQELNGFCLGSSWTSLFRRIDGSKLPPNFVRGLEETEWEG